MDMYISKPVQIGQLISALQDCPALGAAQGQRQPQPGVQKLELAIDEKVLNTFAREMGGSISSAAVVDVIELYLSDAPGLLQTMDRAYMAQDATVLQRTAHTLKSSSALGAMTLTNLCKEVEALARDGQLTDAGNALRRVEAEFTRVRQALEAVSGRPQS